MEDDDTVVVRLDTCKVAKESIMLSCWYLSTRSTKISLLS